MKKIVNFAKHIISLQCYQAAGKDYFNALIKIYPICGVKTPDLNWFGCGFSTLAKAKWELRQQWSRKRRLYVETSSLA